MYNHNVLETFTFSDKRSTIRALFLINIIYTYTALLPKNIKLK